MKYILKKNKLKFNKEFLKFTVIIFVLLILHIFLNISTLSSFNCNFYYSAIGLTSLDNMGLIEMSLKLLSYTLIGILATKVFIENITKNLQYLMLRIDNKKWIISETLNLTIYVIIFRLIYNLILFIGTRILGFNITGLEALKISALDSFLYINISSLIILSTNLFSQNSILKTLSPLPIIIVMISLFLDTTDLTVLPILTITLIFINILNLITFSPQKIYNTYNNK